MQISAYLYPMKNTTLVVSLDTRRQKKDKTYPLILRLAHHNTTTPISLNISLLPKDWDEEKRQIKKSYAGTTSVTRLNNQIQKKKAEATDVLLKLKEANQLDSLSIAAVRARIEGQTNHESFTEYGTRLVKELYKANRVGTAQSYEGVINVLKTFAHGRELRFTDITYSFLTRFETHHKNKGNGVNGLAVYMRTIRAIYNKAIKEGIVERNLYPFYDYKIKTVPTEKRALEITYLKKIVKLQLSQDHLLFHARNYFLASFMMYGMNFTDMAFLEKTDIKNGRIAYRRKKTSKLYDIKVSKNLNAILQYYLKNYQDTKYVFPIIKRDTAVTQSKDIKWARKRYNKKLKLLGQECGIEQNLTSYVSRHSFATQAMLQQIPLNAISAMLGHSSIKTTEIYLKTLPSHILDEYHTKVLSII